MNAPDRYERFVVPEDEKKIKFEKDSRVVNAGTFTVQREDHTLGNLVRMKLLEDKDVIFAGYKLPHPLEYRMLYKVQTKNSSHDPMKAMNQALAELTAEVAAIKTAFESEEQRLAQFHPGDAKKSTAVEDASIQDVYDYYTESGEAAR